MEVKNALSEQEVIDLDFGKKEDRKPIENVNRELRFTEVYRRFENTHPYILEAMCLRAQAREIFLPIKKGDWFAGHLDRMKVGIDPERGDTKDAAWFCEVYYFEEQMEREDLDDKLRSDMEYLLEFWSNRRTYLKCREAFSDAVKKGLPDDDYYRNRHMAFPMFGMGGPCLDYDKLMRTGIPGLREEILQRRKRAVDTKEQGYSSQLYEGMLIALDTFIETAQAYASESRGKALKCSDNTIRSRYEQIAKSLNNICFAPPSCYHEAIQLMWLYNLLSLTKNYGRVDIYLGDFLARDLDSSAIKYEEAFEMTKWLWMKMVERGNPYNNRVVVGGKGRRNPENADRFAILAMEVQMAVKESIPQLTLRCTKDMNPSLWKRAIDAIEKGCTFPIIYNDDVNIPAVAKALDVPLNEAEQYMMYGCGEYIIDHAGIGSPDAALNVAKVLDVTLHNGVESFSGLPMGLALGSLQDFTSFEELKSAFSRQLEYFIDLLAEAQYSIYNTTSKYAAYPLISMLYDNCLEMGKPLLSGGAKYIGGTLECFGNNTTADALAAIKAAVYDQHSITAQELLDCLDSNFEGHEDKRNMLLSLPKFGNDNDDADEMSLKLNHLVCDLTRKKGKEAGLHSFNVVLINNGDSVLFGKSTAATADGRKSGMPLSNGNQPSAGYDRQGLTALLNSMSKLDPSRHAGAVHNLKLSRSMFRKHRTLVESLIHGYFTKGGTQLMITVADARELEEAMAHPENYSNLLVRVGGYSERFVNLPREVQLEVLHRTLHEE